CAASPSVLTGQPADHAPDAGAIAPYLRDNPSTLPPLHNCALPDHTAPRHPDTPRATPGLQPSKRHDPHLRSNRPEYRARTPDRPALPRIPCAGAPAPDFEPRRTSTLPEIPGSHRTGCSHPSTARTLHSRSLPRLPDFRPHAAHTGTTLAPGV